MHRAALLLAPLLLAGCLTPSAAPAPAEAVAPNLPAAAAPLPTIAQRDCEQLHNSFPSPAVFFEPLLPEGFTLVTDGPMARVGVSTNVCASTVAGADLGPTAELWGTVSVLPPAELRGEDVLLYLLPLDMHIGSPALAEVYASWGLTVTDAQVTDGTTLDTPLVVATHVSTTSDAGAYALDTAVRREPADFHEGLIRHFVVDPDLRVTGYVDVGWPGGDQVGVGTATLRFEGDWVNGAPPLTQGFSHHVEHVDPTLAFTPLA